MSWGPVLVGIDASPAAVCAAAVGERIAALANVPCQLIHAVRDAGAPLVAVSGHEDPQVVEMQQLQLAVARQRVNDALGMSVSDQVRQKLDVTFGPAAVVLQEAMRDSRAGLVVLGGKHHSTLERWLGGSTSLHCDVRIIAATHRNLEDAIVAGTFREDLYYRLAVFPIETPPLRTVEQAR